MSDCINPYCGPDTLGDSGICINGHVVCHVCDSTTCAFSSDWDYQKEEFVHTCHVCEPPTLNLKSLIEDDDIPF